MSREANTSQLTPGKGQDRINGDNGSAHKQQEKDGTPMDTSEVRQEGHTLENNGQTVQHIEPKKVNHSNPQNAGMNTSTEYTRKTDPNILNEFDPLQPHSQDHDHHGHHGHRGNHYQHGNPDYDGQPGYDGPHDQYAHHAQHGHHGHPVYNRHPGYIDPNGQYAEHGQQTMAMKQMQRAAEASKQMLYGVYGNVVSILEEYEARTQKTKAERSNIHLPDQSRKTVDDVQSIVQTQLLLFETQQRACPKEVSASVNKELRKKTIHWAAVREEHKMKVSDTDKYICQLYEVLVKGKTKHGILDEPRQPVSAQTIKDNFQHILQGKHDASQIDQQFKADEKKKATSPETRRSEQHDALQLGAKRMSQTVPELVEVLFEDLKEFEAEGPQTTSELR